MSDGSWIWTSESLCQSAILKNKYTSWSEGEVNGVVIAHAYFTKACGEKRWNDHKMRALSTQEWPT